MLKTLHKVLSLFNKKEKKLGKVVLMMVVLMALLETMGLASVIPFLTVLANRDAVTEVGYIAFIYESIGSLNVDSFLIVLGIITLGIIIVSSLYKILTIYAINKYVQNRRHYLGLRLLEVYLRQPYLFYLNRNTSDMTKSILSEIDQLVNNMLKPFFDLIAYSCVALSITIFLFFVDYELAFVVGVVISVAYVSIYLTIQKYVKKIGSLRVKENKVRYASATEALNGIKDIKLFGRESEYLKKFSPASSAHAKYQASAATISQIPKYFVEAIGFGGVILISIILVNKSDFDDFFPLIGMYVFAGYKLLPAAQHIYSSLTKIKYGSVVVDEIAKDFSLMNTVDGTKGAKLVGKLIFSNCIMLSNINFTFQGMQNPVLKDVSISIDKGQSIAIIGKTGAGKSTLIDIMIGLLQPCSGTIVMDKVNILDNVRQWQNSIGYVPQNIYLTDSTIKENIAFGIPENEIDMQKVKRSAYLAQLHEFIENDLDNNYETIVGERGVRLSGGQVQRIGIARALYHDPDILIFDEATSALDIHTEKDVMGAIMQLSVHKTIVSVTHRLSAVKDFDVIYLLDRGVVVDYGKYHEVLSRNESFKDYLNQTS